ncbi:DUF975 family protein [Aerococcus viridans]|uniref:DUF975 family protein n=1 Tax=Aerococcus viridans TaxID=1377 RepID=UPI002DBD3AAD|nr:DUF975 family protein [Aerococcus viridans]MEC1386921.1 DUF975 family protein [Aerococcus viridans]
MSYKISRKASEINKEASAIQQGNTLAIFGATLVTGIITGLITWAIEMITGTTDTTTATDSMLTIAGMVSLIISIFISFPLSLGIDWSVLRLVDEDRFHIGNIFEPFQRRYFRNIWNQIIYTIVIFLWIILFAVVLGGIGVGIFYLTGQSLTPPTDLTAGDYSGLAGLAVGLVLLFIILMTIVTLRLAMNSYLLFDNDRIGGRKPLKVSKVMMKGNKWTLFWIGFQNALYPVLLAIVMFGGLGLLGAFLNNGGILIAILAIIATVAIMIFSIKYTIRQMVATALLYRLITDEHGDDLDRRFPELDLTPDAPVNEYHTEQRPAFTENATAIHPADDVATGTAANQAIRETQAEKETIAADQADNYVGETAATAAGAAAVFSLADEEKAGHDDEVTESSEYKAEAVTDNNAGGSSALRGSYQVGQDVDIRQPYQATYTASDGPISAIRNHFTVEASDYNAERPAQEKPSFDLNAGPASESAAVRRSYVVGGQASSDDATNNEDQTPGKKPYNIMGYNTPDRTDFGKVENAKDVILATDKAESGENGMLNPGDFDKDVDYDPEIDPDQQN